MDKLNIRMFPDKRFYGYTVEVFSSRLCAEKTMSFVVFGNLERAFAFLETESFHNWINRCRSYFNE